MPVTDYVVYNAIPTKNEYKCLILLSIVKTIYSQRVALSQFSFIDK